MKKNLKKLIVLFTCLTILLSVSMVQVYAAPSISAKKVSVYVGKTKQLKCAVTVKNINAKANKITFKTTDGGDFVLNSTKANVKFKMAADCTDVKASVTDATGKTYYSKTFSSCTKNKEYSFQWNGKTSNGKNVEAGAYRICITAGTTKTYSAYLRVYAKTGFSGGNGSSSNPYKVSNLEQLRKISLYPNKHFVQTANISGNYESFQPLCTTDAPFSGSYNGQGYTISTLNISSDSHSALFVAVSGNISNVKIDRFLVNGQSDGYKYDGIGAIAGINKGRIINCVITNTNITGSDSNSCGGVCGFNDGIIQNCTAQNVTSKTSTREADTGAGCIVGKNSGSIISCSAKNITASGWQAGGITGVNTNSGQCVMCEVTGVVNVSAIFNFGNSAGAIAGINEGTVSSCSTTSGIKLVGYGSGIVA